MSHFLSFACLLVAGATAQLSGKVVNVDDKPIKGAIVVISDAKPRVGPATTCPSCYRDCTKRSLTDANGKFTFDGLANTLWFRLAAGAPGSQGVISKYYDPAQRPEITLKLKPLPGIKQGNWASGMVVDLNGQPIPGATVRSRNILRSNGRGGGADSSVSPLTLTDSQGRFEIATGDHIRSIDLRVEAGGFAANEKRWLQGGNEKLTIRLGQGASIRGRLVLGSLPLAATEVGLVQENRVLGNIVTPREISTDADGYFQFENLPPDLEYTIYTHINQQAKGVLPVSLVEAPAHGERADLGNIPTQNPSRLLICVRTDDGSPLPSKSTIYVGRKDAWRGTTLNLPQQALAKVQLGDVGRELYFVHLRVPGYKILKTSPPNNMDINERYSVLVKGETQKLDFVVCRVAKVESPQLGNQL